MIVLLIVVILMLYVVYSGVSLVKDARRTNVPGPTPLPILGNGFLFLGDSTNFLKQLGILRDRYTNIARVHVLSKRFYLFFDPKYIEPIISSIDHITKGEVYRYITPWLGEGLLTSGGNKWKSHRKFLTPAFHFNILQSFLPIFQKNDKVLIKKLRGLADGTSFDLFPIIALAALDNIAESAMGVTINAQNDSDSEYVKSIAEVSEIMSLRMFNILVANDVVFSFHPLSRKQAKALKVLHGHTNEVIKNRVKQLQNLNVSLDNYYSGYDSGFGSKTKCPFLDLLLLSEVDGQRLDTNSVREEVDTFMFEGHDTTASAISFALFCLSKREDVQEQILKEQKNIFGEDLDREPTYNDLHQMKYLELVIKESLRLYPAVPLIGRCLTQDIEIEGLKLLKDSTLTIDIFHIQRNPKYFPDPLEFRPERFTSDSASKSAYSWIAFSAGPRNCIGQKFAMMEVKTVLSSIVKNFKLYPSDIEPILGTDLILRSKNGIYVKMLPRNS